MAKKTIVIGGVAGGASCAARLRRRDEFREIIIFEKGEYISFANCGLPYYIGDVIKSRDALLLQTPEMMKIRFNIDVRIKSEVISIDTKNKTVKVNDSINNREYEESYDELVIATGSSPLKPSIKGIENDNIFTLWNIPDTDKVKSFVVDKKPKTAAVIGAGFIGIEMAENLVEAGLKVTVIEMQDQVMAPVDKEMAEVLHENIRDNNVDLLLKEAVVEFDKIGEIIRVKLKSGKYVDVDMVILSIGVTPNGKLASKTDILTNTRGGIIVDEYLRTNANDVYAVGDVIEVENFITKEKTMIPLAGPANKQGRIAADNIVGDNKKYKGSMGTSVAKVFDLDVAAVGINEKNLLAAGKEKNKDYFTALINQKSHAGYYPGATPLTLKMIFEKDGKILGAQVVGQEGADKRIDTLAVTISLGGTIYDLMDLELAYAPPFSSAKDPVNMLGFVAENILNGMVRFVDIKTFDKWQEKEPDKYIVLDVTEQMERMVFSIPNSYHIPLGQIKNRLDELDKDKTIITYCAVGVRSYNAARTLMQNGFTKVYVLEGGTSFYKSYHHMNRFNLINNDMEKKQEMENQNTSQKEVMILDCSGLQCPGPIMKVHEAICSMNEGEVVKVSATDLGFGSDIQAWCNRTGNTMVSSKREGKNIVVEIKKGTETCEVTTKTQVQQQPQGKTLIVFSGDLDKVLASFIIANGAASMGRPVTMFFTFWGLNALRKSEKVKVKKPFIEKMFGFMMPRGNKKLKLSKMHMAGMGTSMMKKVMKDKNVSSLEELMQQAMDNGIKLVACTMSMDVMGITKEELLDGVELAGVASYLGDAEESNVNLFI